MAAAVLTVQAPPAITFLHDLQFQIPTFDLLTASYNNTKKGINNMHISCLNYHSLTGAKQKWWYQSTALLLFNIQRLNDTR